MSERTPVPWWRHAAQGGASREVLKSKTDEHWQTSQPKREQEASKAYIRELLPFELTAAQDQGNLEVIPCDTLALLVGYSFDPLLQVISVLQPQRIVLVLNTWYGSESDSNRQDGWDRGTDFRKLVLEHLAPLINRHAPPESLPYAPTIEDDDICELPRPEKASPTPPDLPGEVFKVLAGRLIGDLNAGKKVIVDVTGGKKSMDAGAFLFAAYADAQISYVDFEDYDIEKRRPLGYSCKIRPLDNPYRTYKLHDWEQVQVNYEKHHFKRAAEALASFREVACAPRFTREQLAALDQLATVLKLYELWDSGDFRGASLAWAAAEQRQPVPKRPVTVALLGERWPMAQPSQPAETAAQALIRAHDDLQRKPPTFFRTNRLLLPYARDELARAQRLSTVNEDHRSALLRAAGLDELLLKARWVRLWYSQGREGVQVYAPSRARVQLTEDVANFFFALLVEHNDAEHMASALRPDPRVAAADRDYLPIRIKLRDAKRLGIDAGEWQLRPSQGTRLLAEYERDTGLEPATLRDLRNRGIHTYLSVPQPVAAAALRYAQANLDDFEDRWTDLARADALPVTPSRLQAGRLSWSALCEQLHLEFLPALFSV